MLSIVRGFSCHSQESEYRAIARLRSLPWLLNGKLLQTGGGLLCRQDRMVLVNWIYMKTLIQDSYSARRVPSPLDLLSKFGQLSRS